MPGTQGTGSGTTLSAQSTGARDRPALELLTELGEKLRNDGRSTEAQTEEGVGVQRLWGW